MERGLSKRLRSRVREFEDKKITGAALAREIFHVAHQVDQTELRRSLEIYANRVFALMERGQRDHAQLLQVVDEMESSLIDFGY